MGLISSPGGLDLTERRKNGANRFKYIFTVRSETRLAVQRKAGWLCKSDGGPPGVVHLSFITIETLTHKGEL